MVNITGRFIIDLKMKKNFSTVRKNNPTNNMK